MSRNSLRFRDAAGIAARRLAVWISGAEKDLATSPWIHGGAGAPSNGDGAPDGSLYLRTNGSSSTTIYAKASGAYAAAPSTGSDFSATVTGTDEMVNADLLINHATQVGVGVDATVAQVTTARTSGYAAAVRAKVTSLTGDTAGVDYYAFYAIDPTVGEANADHIAFKVGAGYDAALDLSACATGEGDVIVGDNLAAALTVREGSTDYLTVKTTNNAEGVVVGKPLYHAAQIIDMADGAVALVQAAAGAGEVVLSGSALFVDANSGQATEDLTLPPEATSSGLMLPIFNTGGEGIVVKDDGGSTILTLDAGQSGIVACNGTNWFGFMGAVT
jgi:hypothetical protein